MSYKPTFLSRTHPLDEYGHGQAENKPYGGKQHQIQNVDDDKTRQMRGRKPGEPVPGRKDNRRNPVTLGMRAFLAILQSSMPLPHKLRNISFLAAELHTDQIDFPALKLLLVPLGLYLL